MQLSTKMHTRHTLQLLYSPTEDMQTLSPSSLHPDGVKVIEALRRALSTTIHSRHRLHIHIHIPSCCSFILLSCQRKDPRAMPRSRAFGCKHWIRIPSEHGRLARMHLILCITSALDPSYTLRKIRITRGGVEGEKETRDLFEGA